MPSSSIRLRKNSSQVDEQTSQTISPKSAIFSSKVKNNLSFILIILLAMFIMHQGIFTTIQFIEKQAQQKEEGIKCLMEYKGSNCNPLAPTDECNSLFQCIKRSDENINEIEVATALIEKICHNLSEKAVGPIALVILLIIINAMDNKNQ